MAVLRRWRDAVSFLTILPVGGSVWTPSEELARSVAFFPVVGLMIGAGSVAVITLFDGILGQNAANALLVLYLVVVTGGLHIDGLADTVDGFAGGRTTERRLEIMRSGSSGPVGVAAVTMVLLLKYTLLSGLAGGTLLVAALVVPALARWPIVAFVSRLQPVRTDGLGQVFAGRIKVADLAFATTFVVVLIAGIAYLWGYQFWAPLAALFLWALVSIAVVRRLLGGITGDILGAMVEVSEVLMLTLFLVIQ